MSSREKLLISSYQQLFFDGHIRAIVNKDSSEVNLSYLGANEDVASFSLKGIGSLFYGILSSIHHRSVRSFRFLEIRKDNDSLKKMRTYCLNILYGFICIEILSLVFSFSQKYINGKKLMNLAPSESPDSDLKWKIVNLSGSYQSLTNLHEKVLENYRGNLQKYLIQLQRPWSSLIK